MLKATKQGHFETAQGLEMANDYLKQPRESLCLNELSDFELANAVYLAGRNDLSLIVYQEAAKQRIRWLSAQLALAQEELARVLV